MASGLLQRLFFTFNFCLVIAVPSHSPHTYAVLYQESKYRIHLLAFHDFSKLILLVPDYFPPSSILFLGFDVILSRGAPTVVVQRQSSAPCRCYRTSVTSTSLKRSNLLLVKQNLFLFFFSSHPLSLQHNPCSQSSSFFAAACTYVTKGMLTPDVT